MEEKKPFITILKAGLLAGALDGLAAVTYSYLMAGTSPVRVFQFIASGVWGKEAFSGGLLIAVCGLLFHFVIAFSWTTLFFFAYPKIPMLSKNKYLSGLSYGVLIWLVMNLAVLPLSNVSQGSFTLRGVSVGVLFLMFCVGLPVSLIVHKHYSSNKIDHSATSPSSPLPFEP